MQQNSSQSWFSRCAKSILINNEKDPLKYDISNYIGFPCFIKSNGCGSSYGISKVTQKICQLLTKLFT